MTMPPLPLTLDRGELRGSLIAHKIATNRSSTGKILKNSNLLSKNQTIPKKLLVNDENSFKRNKERYAHARLEPGTLNPLQKWSFYPPTCLILHFECERERKHKQINHGARRAHARWHWRQCRGRASSARASRTPSRTCTSSGTPGTREDTRSRATTTASTKSAGHRRPPPQRGPAKERDTIVEHGHCWQQPPNFRGSVFSKNRSATSNDLYK